MAIAEIIETISADGGAAPRLNELGKIKIGGLGAERRSSTGGTYRAPRKDDHFTITTLRRGAGGDLVPDDALMRQLAANGLADDDGKLRQLPVRVLSDEIDDVLQAGFVWYGGKTVGARSDGREVEWFNDARTGRRLAEPRREPWDPAFMDLRDSRNNRLFKLHAVFNCVIAAREARWGGVYKFRTTSLITFRQLYASLVHIHELTGGILRGMPLMLCVRPIQVSPEGRPTTVHVVHCELRGAELKEIQEQALRQAAWQLENKQRLIEVRQQYRKLLVAPGHESGDEAGDIAGEFQPEAQVIDAAPEHYDLLDGDAEPRADGADVIPTGTSAAATVDQPDEPTPPAPPQQPQQLAAAPPSPPVAPAPTPAAPPRPEPAADRVAITTPGGLTLSVARVLAPEARKDQKLVDELIVKLKPPGMTAKSARDAFHAHHRPNSWGAIPPTEQDRLYALLIDGGAWGA